MIIDKSYNKEGKNYIVMEKGESGWVWVVKYHQSKVSRCMNLVIIVYFAMVE